VQGSLGDERRIVGLLLKKAGTDNTSLSTVPGVGHDPSGSLVKTFAEAIVAPTQRQKSTW